MAGYGSQTQRDIQELAKGVKDLWDWNTFLENVKLDKSALSDAIDSNSSVTAASSAAVKVAYDLAKAVNTSKVDAAGAAHAASPKSASAQSVALPASGGVVAAPSDGYLVFEAQTSESSVGQSNILLVGQTTALSAEAISALGGALLVCFVPVTKSDKVQIIYASSQPFQRLSLSCNPLNGGK